MNRASLVVLLAILLATAVQAHAAETPRKTIWQGAIHLGDNPEQYSNFLTAGIVLQIPCKLDAEKPGKLMITTRDVQTLAGEGHYAELMAHFEEGDGPAREYVVETFRIKDDSTNVDTDHTFKFEPLKGLMARPAYYSVRIKVDTLVKFSLWDDFLVKRIDIEQ